MALKLLCWDGMPRALPFPELPEKFAFPVALALMLFIGWLDYITGYYISFFIFYAVPILMTVRYCDRNSAILMALLSGIVWWWADWKSGHPYFVEWGQIWETNVRLAFFMFVVWGGSAMKTKHEAVRAQLQALSRQRELEREIVVASDQEQQRIGRDLHDGLCQFLAGIGCAVTSLKDDLRAKFDSESETAAEIEELLRDAVMQARNVARGLAPVQMEDAGLVAALEELAANTSRRCNLACEFEGTDAAFQPTPEVATHLYRIAQEATNNAVKHAQATSLHISLNRFAETIHLVVEDNGTGLPAGAERKGGMGLKTMQYRARSIGGRLTVTGSGRGTAVICILPAQSADSEAHVTTT